MKPYFFIIIFAFFTSCQSNGLSKEERTAYLEAHIENSNYLIGNTFGEYERYKMMYREDTSYINTFKLPFHDCGEFWKIIKENATTNDKINSSIWEKIEKQQVKTFQNLDNTFPLFAQRKIPLPQLENTAESSSSELLLAKYFSNCHKMTEYLLEQLVFAENPTTGFIRQSFKPINILTNSDTILLNQTISSIATHSLFVDFEKYTTIKKFNDIEIKKIDFSTGKFKINIIGPNPKITITYYDARKVSEIDYEINL